MHRWAKRGIQAALVTGGMFMLGAGVAAAAESCPDRPSSPLDGVIPIAGPSVRVPVDVDKNVVGTPIGQVELPAVHQEINTRDLGLPSAGSGHGDTALLGSNRVVANVLAPVGVEGNAIALGGPANVANNSDRIYSQPESVVTNGNGGSVAGNVVAVSGAVPVGLHGNAIGAAGSAHTQNNSTSGAHTSGSVYTEGDDSSLSGNVVHLPVGLPIKADSNAIGVAGGYGKSDGQTNTVAVAGGTVTTRGNESSASGNVVGVPLAQSLGLEGNALGGPLGHEDATSGAATYVQSGGDTVTQSQHSPLSGNLAGVPLGNPLALSGNAAGLVTNATTHGASQDTSVAGGNSMTTGDDGFAAGNIIGAPQALPVQGTGNAVGGIINASATYDRQVSSTAGGNAVTTGNGAALAGNSASLPVAGPLGVMGNGGGLVANATSSGNSAASTGAGGATSTAGNGGFGSGSLPGVPLALPVMATGNGGGLITNTHTAHTGFTAAHTGGNTSTAGNGSMLSGLLADGPVTAPGVIAGNIGGVLANGTAAGSSDQNAAAGGIDQTAGINSTMSGGVAHIPAVVPVGHFGNVHGVAVNGVANHVNRQYGHAGGSTFTRGDDSVGSGEVVGSPVSAPIGDFGNVTGVLVNGTANGTNAAIGHAGGFTGTNGQDGVAGGDIVQPAAGVPLQYFGSAAGVLVNGTGVGTNSTTVTANQPGNSTIDDAGTLTSDEVSPQLASGVQAFGNAIGLLSNITGHADNTTDTAAGGPNQATGVGGTAAGDVVTVPIAHPEQVFGNGVSIAGRGFGFASSDTHATAGGLVSSDGTGGSLAGDVTDAPVAGAGQEFGNALAVLGVSGASAANHTASAAGGDVVTAGDANSVAGQHTQAPVRVLAQGFGRVYSIGGVAHGSGVHQTDTYLGGVGLAQDQSAMSDGDFFVLPAIVGVNFYNLPAEVLADAMAGNHAALVDEDTVVSRRSGISLPEGTDKLPQVSDLPGLPPLGALTSGVGIGGPSVLPVPHIGGSTGSSRALIPHQEPAVGNVKLPLQPIVPAVDTPAIDDVLAKFGDQHVAQTLSGAPRERAAQRSDLGALSGSTPALSALDSAAMLRDMANQLGHSAVSHQG